MDLRTQALTTETLVVGNSTEAHLVAVSALSREMELIFMEDRTYLDRDSQILQISNKNHRLIDMLLHKEPLLPQRCKIKLP